MEAGSWRRPRAFNSFVTLEFPKLTDPHAVYVETMAGDLYLEERTDTTDYTIAFERSRATALSSGLQRE
ncbi:Scr1 family TA system antitoxin-like transcriptional regulator [Streptosporangium oxazolinicum]|uniref:Scr1 family TA system antitoxin-like transcriptional regulator n=1 Tax=Streptosporangium oxazolinicum TaxID=909287 RepID=UPI003CD08A4A